MCAERELVLQSQYSMYLGVVLIILLMILHSAHVVIVDFQLLFIGNSYLSVEGPVLPLEGSL